MYCKPKSIQFNCICLARLTVNIVTKWIYSNIYILDGNRKCINISLMSKPKMKVVRKMSVRRHEEEPGLRHNPG